MQKRYVSKLDLNKIVVRSNPEMLPYERETIILMNDTSISAEITTWQRIWVQHLLEHRFFEVEHVWMTDDNTIVGVDGRIPKNCIRSSFRPRKRFDKI
jgi:hypothetical protein